MWRGETADPPMLACQWDRHSWAITCATPAAWAVRPYPLSLVLHERRYRAETTTIEWLTVHEP